MAYKKSLQQQPFFQEYISIKPRYSVVYSRCTNPEVLTPRVKIKPLVKPPDNRSYNRLNNALNFLVMTSKREWVYSKVTKKRHMFYLNFITLTLSETQKHNDYVLKELLLEPMLRWILQRGATGYVWKAEVQQNGNIHFHITTNKFIHYQEIRDKWNTLQFRHGYLDKYQTIHNDTDANSTDVKAIKNVGGAIKYMIKYLLKAEPDKRKIEGHNFGYSRNLAKVKINMETTAQGMDKVFEYLASIEKSGKYLDYATLYSHELIDLKKCPSLLRDIILEATAPPKRKSSKSST